MKKLFEFTIPKVTVETVSKESTNDKGEKTTTEKEEVKTENNTVVLKKPNRGLYDEAELFYGVRLAEGIKAGLLTRALLAKRFSNDGGVMSETDKEQYADLYIRLFEVQNNIERSALIPDAEKTEEERGQLVDWLRESAVAREDIQDFEISQASLFDQTAENRARTKTILWWVLNLAYFKKGGEHAPVYEGETFEEKLGNYDKLEDDDNVFWEELSRKLIYYVSFWYVGKAQTQEDFEALLREIDETQLDEIVEESLAEEETEPPKEEPEKKPKKAKTKKKEPAKEEPVKEEPVKEEPVKEEPVKEEADKDSGQGANGGG